MPDLPTLARADAAPFAECWDAVLSYADLCTSGAPAAGWLATEAFALGKRAARATESAAVHGVGRRPGTRLPDLPLLLTAVRTTATTWEADGRGRQLSPDLRRWLNSGEAARYTGPRLQRPIALRGLRDMQEADAGLLWLAETEARPLSAIARRLGLDPATAHRELEQARELFRDRCRRAHLDTPMDARCRGYARLLDGVTRSPAARPPEDLSRHLATCARCAEAADCLRLDVAALPAALADGVLGWGGRAYLERRRRAAEAHSGTGGPAGPDADADTDVGADPGDPRETAGRNRVLRGGLLATAVTLSVLALGASMMPFGGSDEAGAETRDDRRYASGPGLSPLSADPLSSASASHLPKAAATGPDTARRVTRLSRGNTDPQTEPRSRSVSPSGSGSGCHVRYDTESQWSDGFQATVTVTTAEPLTGWRVDWSFRDGQRVGQMWDASAVQHGSRVTATAAVYNGSVGAGRTLSFGFLASWSGRNSAPFDFTLNGARCRIG